MGMNYYMGNSLYKAAYKKAKKPQKYCLKKFLSQKVW
jgi:hypothetical protein